MWNSIPALSSAELRAPSGVSRRPSGFTAGALLLLLSAQPTIAVTDTWDGGGIGPNISTGGNWVDNSAPLSSLTNTDLLFAGIVNTNPNFPVPFSVNSIAFSLSSGQFQLFGEPLTIGSGGIKNDDAG